MRWLSLLTTATVLAAMPAAAQIREADVRAFVARQEAAWNASQLDRYFASFTADATFTDQAYVGDKPPVPYGASTLDQARANARKAFAGTPTPREAGRVLRVEMAPDGRSGRVVSVVGSTVWDQGRARRLCATRVQALIETNAGLRAVSRTDTYVKCRRG
ncbi:hypothetical protein [Phenylobacterium kunshanense]|uniref:DUF4440 domain-containing protein n=1 Tax=Phenylobacterium kunshanense TaxID=1445034 RepID=A0A328BEW9_9CAUL|nr:hypothetical protein [Phenylobacterium kunshanense]RAK64404.1 hypothetical protein DJ019_14680 [Phenylobacterium kunshanense]